MRTITPPAVLLALTLAACGSELPTAVGRDATALARADGAAAPARPIRGRCELTFNPPPLPLPPLHVQTDVGSCQLSHLGHTTSAGVQEIDFAAGTQVGTRTFTAANGDELHTAHTGTSHPAGPGRVAFVATITFTGGTGRFAGATGQVTGRGEANLATRTTVVELEGWISY